jgi:hypothetical protein
LPYSFADSFTTGVPWPGEAASIPFKSKKGGVLSGWRDEFERAVQEKDDDKKD